MRRASVFAVLLLSGGRIAAADDITLATVVAVERWVDAVKSHTPGQRDGAVEMVVAWSFADRTELNPSMKFFLSSLCGKPVTVNTPAAIRLASVAGGVRKMPGPDAFLKRAAVLHADAAFTRETTGAGSPEPRGPAPRGSDSSALLSHGSLFINRDGEILGVTPTDWNWPFARSLLDLLTVLPATDPFVGTWYHATSAFMLKHGLYGEVITHLLRAAVVLPDDARILFDRACYSEILGLPRTQVLLSDQAVMSSRAARAGGSGLIKIPAGPSGQLGIPVEDDANEEAERLFRRALRADPSFVEARVRLGRLLGMRKRHDEAASELATALTANPPAAVRFYAHLLAGRSAQALGKIADATGHYRAADSLFPGAQSSGLARSQAALLESDVPAALELVQRVDNSPPERDPWRWYQLGAGRDADALLRHMWSQVSR